MTTRRLPSRRTVRCALVGAFVLLLASFEPAAAQFPPPPGPNEPQMPSAGPFPAPSDFGVPPRGGFVTEWPAGRGQPSEVQSEAQRICLTFPAIRKEVENGAAGIRAAGDRKATREDVCPLFKAYAVKEAEMVKFLVTHRQLCGVPPGIVKQVKQNHDKTMQICDDVCGAGAVSSCRPKVRLRISGLRDSFLEAVSNTDHRKDRDGI